MSDVIRPYHTLFVPDNMIAESLLVLIVPKPASGTCATKRVRQQRNGPEVDLRPVTAAGNTNPPAA